MDCNFTAKISLMIDDRLPSAETEAMKNHLAVCDECRQAEQSFLAMRERIHSIPIRRDAAAQQKILGDILKAEKTERRNSFFTPLRLAVTACALLLVIFAGSFLYLRLPQKSLEVVRLNGTPKIGAENVNETERLKIGEWLETDSASRAKISVADVGTIEVEPETRLRLIETRADEHRLELAHGFISAQINAPPRLFFVNTPSATVIDYGCAYTLNVDEAGDSVLFVTEGWVSLALNGRESLVPASAYAKSRRGSGPGTPYFEDASGEFIVALTRFDFGNGGSSAIDVLLAQSRQRDALSLWYLLERADAFDRPRIFDRLATFVPLPENATREGVLALNQEMLRAWKETIDFVSVGSSFDSENQNTTNPSRIVSIGNMTVPRAGHTATRLADGRVLIVGGKQKEETALSSAEIYDPTTKNFSPTGAMNVARFGHTATLLSNGKVLITGGTDANGNSLLSAEIYDPTLAVFSSTATMSVARSNHQATLLPDGKVLVTGGIDTNRSALSSAEIYEPEKMTFLATENMIVPREFHAATPLADGSVLVTGGRVGSTSPSLALASAELYDSAAQKFVLIGNMTEKRYSHAATNLADGRVLITGGSTGRDWKDQTSSAEIYDARTKSFDRTGAMSLRRFNHSAATLRLADGRGLIVGAGARLEIFDPTSGIFSSTAGNIGTGRVFSTATQLLSGEVLIVGGYNFGYPPTASAWLYSP